MWTTFLSARRHAYLSRANTHTNQGRGKYKNDKLDVRFLGPVRLSYNPYFSACLFSQNSVFLSQQISQNSVLVSAKQKEPLCVIRPT